MNLLGLTYSCATNVDCANQNQMQFEGFANNLDYKESNDINASKDFGTISPIYYPLYLPNKMFFFMNKSWTYKGNSSNTPTKTCSPI